MPRPKKGPHTWFRPERIDAGTGKRIAAGQWLIIDGTKQIGTGRAQGEAAAADRDLAEYVVAKWQPPRRVKRIEEIGVADVLAVYDADRGHKQVNQRAYTGRMLRLNEWWGDKVLADVNGASCRQYEASRGSAGGARRDLEDLRAAIVHHEKEGLHTEIVRVSLPLKGRPRTPN